MEKYEIQSKRIATFLAQVKDKKIVIPNIQRPFVWGSTDVCKLVDSLYKDFPVGYVVTCVMPQVHLKDGSLSANTIVLIDGQQRMTALKAAILGDFIVDKNYSKKRVRIAFNPVTEEFKVSDVTIEQSKKWISDISVPFESVFSEDGKGLDFSDIKNQYFIDNPDLQKDDRKDDYKKVGNSFSRLEKIINNHVGVIELSSRLDIETITEIFVRINSTGKRLNQTDFVMSKIAADTAHGGDYLWKTIEYFCHTAQKPEFWDDAVEKDPEFMKTDYAKMIRWLKDEKDDLYDPEYSDLIRVAFVSQFNRGKLSEFVSLLSGRDFDKRIFDEKIIEDTFLRFDEGVRNFINENNFKGFLQIIRSAGFISPTLIHFSGVLNFSYILYLKLKSKLRQLRGNDSSFEHIIRRWFVFSILTNRYTSSQETTFDEDIKRINDGRFEAYFESETKLVDDFWTRELPKALETSSASSPLLGIFWAAQVKANDNSFLSTNISIRDMLYSGSGDIHHLFPKDYLKKNNCNQQSRYNQIANLVYIDSNVNKSIGNKSPKDYLNLVSNQTSKRISNQIYICNITSKKELQENLTMNCIPSGFDKMVADDYDKFLNKRRKLMAQKIREYYESL
ncbi:MAG: DUF262 domain-containing protein [Planctomycetaceae bacterium]|jgi:hypothetical protein|nr:DUF262 domain-containing protein [Planctomycetaceae bacterium]